MKLLLIPIMVVIFCPLAAIAQKNYLSEYEENKKTMLMGYPKEKMNEAEFYFDAMSIAGSLIGESADKPPSEERRAFGASLYEKIKKQRPEHEEIKNLDALTEACKNEPSTCQNRVLTYTAEIAKIPDGKLTRLRGKSWSVTYKGQGHKYEFKHENKNSVVTETIKTKLTAEGITIQTTDGRTTIQISAYKIGNPNETELESYLYNGILKTTSDLEKKAEDELNKKLEEKSEQEIIRLFRNHESSFPSSVRASVLFAVYLAEHDSLVQAHKRIISSVKKFPNEVLPKIILSGILRSARTAKIQRLPGLVKKRLEFIEQNSNP